MAPHTEEPAAMSPPPDPSPAASQHPAAAPPRPRRILFFHTAEGARLTGGPRMVHALVSRLDRTRFTPCFVTPGPTELSGALEADGVDVRTVALPAGLDVYGHGLARPSPRRVLAALRGAVGYSRRVHRVMRDFDPELVWVSNLRTFLSIFPAAWWHHVPVVWNIWLGQRSHGLVHVMNAFALRRARRIVTEYRAQAAEIFTAAQMVRALPRIRTVYSGHDVPELASPAARSRPFTVGVLGAFSPRKNQRLFLEAARVVRNRAPEVRFLIGGEAATPADEAYAHELREIAAASGLDPTVEWCGWIERPFEFLDRLDAYVQTSDHEGLPGAVREAMLAGLPVIGTDVGGTREAIVDGETGWVVPRGNARAIADAVVRLAADPEKARGMGRAGRRRAEELFSRDAYVHHYEEVLAEVLAEA
jgi:glycosyltransferase involved in cell wall biosynthesis